jgi:hypothetical protein
MLRHRSVIWFRAALTSGPILPLPFDPLRGAALCLGHYDLQSRHYRRDRRSAHPVRYSRIASCLERLVQRNRTVLVDLRQSPFVSWLYSGSVIDHQFWSQSISFCRSTSHGWEVAPHRFGLLAMERFSPSTSKIRAKACRQRNWQRFVCKDREWASKACAGACDNSAATCRSNLAIKERKSS